MPTPSNMKLADAWAILREHVRTPCGVSISHEGGKEWPVIRFMGLSQECRDDSATMAEVAVALEVILQREGVVPIDELNESGA